MDGLLAIDGTCCLLFLARSIAQHHRSLEALQFSGRQSPIPLHHAFDVVCQDAVLIGRFVWHRRLKAQDWRTTAARDRMQWLLSICMIQRFWELCG